MGILQVEELIQRLLFMVSELVRDMFVMCRWDYVQVGLQYRDCSIVLNDALVPCYAPPGTTALTLMNQLCSAGIESPVSRDPSPANSKITQGSTMKR